MSNPPSFGHSMRQACFNFAPDYVPLNHGSFGTYPASVFRQLQAFQCDSEARPDHFIRYEIPQKLDESRDAIASLLRVPVAEVVFVPNVTTGVNTVLRSLRFQPGEVIVYFSTIYSVCEKTVEYLIESTPVQGEKVDLQYPIADDEVVRRFEEALTRLKTHGKNARVAIFDTVSSVPGVRVPWERLVESCRNANVMSLIDGAHGVGHLSLTHLKKVDPDFFVSNCHKWLFVPRGCCVFYVPVRNQALIRSSLPTSHGFKPMLMPGQAEGFNPLPSSGRSDFVEMFQFTATIDVSPYLCMEEALKFRREVCGGEEKIMDYCHELARQGGKHAAAVLGTEALPNGEGTCFANVRLPFRVGNGPDQIKYAEASPVVAWMTKTLDKEYNTFIAIYPHAGSLWARFSGQIYLETNDFIWGADVLKTLCQRVSDGEHLEITPRL